MTNREWEERILERRIAVSDTVQFTCGSASLSCYDPDHGIIYSVYHASRTKYGEARDVFALMIIPVCQPHKTENLIIVEDGVPVDGKVYSKMIDGNCIFVNGIVRIYFLNRGNQYYFVDFDPKTKTFSAIQPVYCCFDSRTYELTDRAVAEYLTSRGLTGWEFNDVNEHIINTGKMYRHGAYWYGCITSYWCQPIIYRSKDGTNFEFVGHVDATAEHECQTAILNGTMYALLRGAKKDNFFVSDDLGASFRPCGRIEFNTTRPQMMPYRGKLLIAISEKGILPNYIRDGRNNMKLLYGEGDDLTQYREIFHIVDPYGIVYYDLIDYKGTLYMIWSNADLYIDKDPVFTDRPQGKDLLYYARIGDLSPYMEDGQDV